MLSPQASCFLNSTAPDDDTETEKAIKMHKLVDLSSNSIDEGVTIVSTTPPQITAVSALQNPGWTIKEASRAALEQFHAGMMCGKYLRNLRTHRPINLVNLGRFISLWHICTIDEINHGTGFTQD